MKRASDFRYAARKALSGKWGIAVLAGFIASLLGGVASSGGGSGFDFSEEETTPMDPETAKILLSIMSVVFVVAFVTALVYLFIGSVVKLGYSRFNLNLIDGEEVKISQVVSYFPHWTNAVCTNLLTSLYIILWSLLFFIPGIIAIYSYAMTPYILAENPTMRAREAIRLSKEMMRGNKWRLFCLEMSFIGWAFLCVFTLGIGSLWLVPYQHASFADFYREISGTRKVVEIPTESAPEAAQATEV